MKKRYFLLSVCLIILIFSACSGVRPVPRYSTAPHGRKEPDIRVLLFAGTDEVKIVSTGSIKVTAPNGPTLMHSKDSASLTIVNQPSGLYLNMEPDGNVSISDIEVVVVPEKGASLSIENISYPGIMKIYPASTGLSIVNILPLEKYLEGVLPHEMGNPGPDGFAALEAQAIAARTYALAKMKKRRNERFDVFASIMDQIYRGTKGTFQLADGAIRDTRGCVLDFNGELVRAYYCANCGGHTSDIRRVWPEREPAPYLTGVLDADVVSKKTCCREGRRFRWRFSFSGRSLGEIIRVTLPRELGVKREDVGELRDIRLLERSASGRVTAIEIETAKGLFRINGDRIRWVLMPDVEKRTILPSTMFNIHKSMEGVVVSFVSITGGGNGHGVGMCQAGAIGMSKRGYTYRMILSHYYPGCRIIREY